MKVDNIFSDILLIKENIYEDSRGYFSEAYNKNEFKKIGIEEDFIQDNFSFSMNAFTIRGMHFQNKPNAQSKLLRVINGSIMDIFIDLRKKSSTYMMHHKVNMKSTDGWLYIPKGFAHGFCTLEDNTLVVYKVDSFYSKESELGILWNDPFFNLDWPTKLEEPIISDKDSSLPIWKDIEMDINF